MNFAKFVKITFFAEHDRATASDYSSIKVVNVELANENLNYEHVYMRPEVNSNRFEISNRFEMPFRFYGNLHKDSLRHLSKQ